MSPDELKTQIAEGVVSSPMDDGREHAMCGADLDSMLELFRVTQEAM